MNAPQRAEQAVGAGWDIVVVDEAHHLRWCDGEASPEYRVVESLAVAASGLLLLTATPEQLGVEAHFARLRLLDPAKYHDLDLFRRNEAGYQVLGKLVTALGEEFSPHDGALLGRLSEYLGPEQIESLRSSNPSELPAARAAAVDALLDRHGTGRVLFRNTRATIGGFPGRVYVPHPLQAPAAYHEALAALGDGSDISCALRPEQALGLGWNEVDPRVPWLISLLRDRRGEKVLVICARAAAAQTLEEHLRTRGGTRTAVFHEGMSLIARDRAAAYFTEEEDHSAQVMVASEIGSEGRNFQSAQHLVLFDLPIIPDLLEQRIGRLDRIGQRFPIQIHVPYYVASPQEVLTRWYQEGLRIFEVPTPAANSVHERLGERLAGCLRDYTNVAACDALVVDARIEIENTRRLLQDGRERLLEANSFRPVRAQAVVEAVASATHELELMDYMERVFDQFGVDQERHSQQAMVLRPGDHMLHEQFPGLPEDGVTATFSRVQALAREDMQFLTWEHPMVLGSMDLVLHGEIGNTAVSTLRLPSVKAGVLLVEALFVLECPGPRELQLRRYLSAAVVRVLVDANGADLSGALSAKQLGQLVRRVPIGTAQQIVRETREEVAGLIESAQYWARAQEGKLIAVATGRAQTILAGELGRVRALAAVNPSIDAADIEHFETLLEDTVKHLQQGQLMLDAIRLAVTV